MIFEVLQNKHDEIVVFQLSEECYHQLLDKGFNLPIDHGLQGLVRNICKEAWGYSHLSSRPI